MSFPPSAVDGLLAALAATAPFVAKWRGLAGILWEAKAARGAQEAPSNQRHDDDSLNCASDCVAVWSRAIIARCVRVARKTCAEQAPIRIVLIAGSSARLVGGLTVVFLALALTGITKVKVTSPLQNGQQEADGTDSGAASTNRMHRQVETETLACDI